MYVVRLNDAEKAPLSFTTFLYNEPHFIAKQPCEHYTTFSLYHTKKRRVDARMHLFWQGSSAVSPCRAPFGSIEVNASLLAQHLDFFINAVSTFVKKRGLSDVRITSYPFCYAPLAAPTLTASLLRNGFVITNSELNYHIPVFAKPFTELFHYSERRLLQKSLNAGFTFTEEKTPDLVFVYDFIKACRQRRGFPITLELENFIKLFNDLPGVYQVFSVKDRNHVAALTVTVRVNQEIVYNFYLADSEVYRNYSPSVLLIKGLYEYCQQHKFKLLDLGIATDQSRPNYGLMQFKQSMGAEPSLKLSFSKLL